MFIVMDFLAEAIFSSVEADKMDSSEDRKTSPDNSDYDDCVQTNPAAT